jgi:hypothetical protein
MAFHQNQIIIFSSGLLLLFYCSDLGSVKLSLDFSKKPEWRYSLSAAVYGTIASADTQRAFSSAARCTLSGRPDAKRPGVLHASVASVSVASNILDDAAVRNLTEQVKSVRLSCALADGVILPEDSSAVPVVKIGGWDLYKDLAKTVPALPGMAVRPGAVWERERIIPLDTKQGGATGHLFQSFCLDSLGAGPSGGKTAALSWKFSYHVELREHDTLGLYGGVPTEGSGTGRAVVDVTGKTLETASVHFTVPAPKQGKFRISWNEDITLSLVK